MNQVMERVGGMQNRNVRVDDELWQAAQDAAQAQGENVAVVIRRALVAYVAQYGTGRGQGSLPPARVSSAAAVAGEG